MIERFTEDRERQARQGTEELAAALTVLRERVQTSAGYNPAGGKPPYQADARLTVDDVATVYAAMRASERLLNRLIDTCAYLQTRNSQLESASGALMVDREHGITAALDRATGAELLACEIAKKAGLDMDIPTEAADRQRARDEQLTFFDRRAERLDAGRLAMLNVLESLRKKSDGLTADEVAKVVGALERANQKATG